jgi:hypothetical protein
VTEYDFDQIRKVCKCGHDIVTHHEGKHNCLGLYCDCAAYVNEHAKEGLKKVKPTPVQDDEDDEDDDQTPLPWFTFPIKRFP